MFCVSYGLECGLKVYFTFFETVTW